MDSVLGYFDAHPSLVLAIVLAVCYTDARLSVRPILVRTLTILEALGAKLSPDELAAGQKTAEGEVSQATTTVASVGARVLGVFKNNAIVPALLACALLVGCAAIDAAKIQHLRQAIHDERDAVSPVVSRAVAVAINRAAIDADLDAMEAAVK